MMASLLRKISKRPAKDAASRNDAIIIRPATAAQPMASNANNPIVIEDNEPAKKVNNVVVLPQERAAHHSSTCDSCKKQRLGNGNASSCRCVAHGKAPAAAAAARFETPMALPFAPPQPSSKAKGRPELRCKRLMKEYQDIMQRADKTVFTVELIDNNLFDWNVSLLQVDPDSALHRDMRAQNVSRILLNLSFPDNFPFAPPFMRVVHPRIVAGYVLHGGAICMELLTPEGWSSAYQVEAIVHQFRALVVKGEGRLPAKDKGNFTKKEAEQSFKSIVRTHKKYGWVTPPNSEG